MYSPTPDERTDARTDTTDDGITGRDDAAAVETDLSTRDRPYRPPSGEVIDE